MGQAAGVGEFVPESAVWCEATGKNSVVMGLGMQLSTRMLFSKGSTPRATSSGIMKNYSQRACKIFSYF